MTAAVGTTMLAAVLRAAVLTTRGATLGTAVLAALGTTVLRTSVRAALRRRAAVTCRQLCPRVVSPLPSVGDPRGSWWRWDKVQLTTLLVLRRGLVLVVVTGLGVSMTTG